MSYRKAILHVFVIAVLLAFLSCSSQPPADTPAEEQAVDRTAWFRQAKFGMFIHWGPYSLASVEASWPIMAGSWLEKGLITEEEYRALPKKFNPVKYDPDAWVRLAKAAGQKYMVFTTKHHDGFAMFDSAYTDYKITNTPYGEDVVKKLADAAARQGMPLGFYYSPPDMNHPGFRDTSKLSKDNWNGEPERAEWSEYLDYMEAQLRELLTGYGDVALIWFDGLRNQEKYNGERFLKLIHELQPATLVNNRIGVSGDYATPEQFVPDRIPTKTSVALQGTTVPDQSGEEVVVPSPEEFRLWETCMTINDTWGYNKNDRDFKSSTELIRALVDVASKGGNFLLNVGPTPEGEIPPELEERLLEIGRWLEVNGESIYGTTYGPLQQLPFGKSTARDGKIYLHVFDWPSGSLDVSGLGAKVSRVTLLANGQELPFQQDDAQLRIELPDEAPSQHVSVVVLDL